METTEHIYLERVLHLDPQNNLQTAGSPKLCHSTRLSLPDFLQGLGSQPEHLASPPAPQSETTVWVDGGGDLEKANGLQHRSLHARLDAVHPPPGLP